MNYGLQDLNRSELLQLAWNALEQAADLGANIPDGEPSGFVVDPYHGMYNELLGFVLSDMRGGANVEVIVTPTEEYRLMELSKAEEALRDDSDVKNNA
jgi:hypothetical protein